MRHKKALIGYTGFVGSTIARQSNFDDAFNSSNIEAIRGNEYQLVVCAAAPGAKWLANKYPDNDTTSINKLIDSLDFIKSDKFILMSTVDVYDKPIRVNENTKIIEDNLHPYGKNRLILEKYVASRFKNSLTIRLPGLFGPGLKKNLIYDLIHGTYRNYINKASTFQFYPLNNLWQDVTKAIALDLKLVNFATEPISVDELLQRLLGRKKFEDVVPKVSYEVSSLYAHQLGTSANYMYTKQYILDKIKQFIAIEQQKL